MNFEMFSTTEPSLSLFSRNYSISSIFRGRERIIRSAGMLIELSIIYFCSIALLKSSSLYLIAAPIKLTRPCSSRTFTYLSLQRMNPLRVILKIWTLLQTKQVSCPAASWDLRFLPSFSALGWIDYLRHFSHRQSPQNKTLGRLKGSSNFDEHIRQCYISPWITFFNLLRSVTGILAVNRKSYRDASRLDSYKGVIGSVKSKSWKRRFCPHPSSELRLGTILSCFSSSKSFGSSNSKLFCCLIS